MTVMAIYTEIIAFSLTELKTERDKVNDFESWAWDNGKWSSYKRISSENGFYIPYRELSGKQLQSIAAWLRWKRLGRTGHISR